MLDIATKTSRGEREYNEDYLVYKKIEDQYFFILADGLGAHGLGNIASQGTCDIMMENSPKYGLEEAIQIVQKTLLEEQERNCLNGKMKTTITALTIKNGKYHQLHLGDSRIYHFNKLKLIHQTKDHSVCQRLVDANIIKQSDIRSHKDKNKLLEVLGMKWTEEEPYTIKEEKLRKYEAILMCSDGFWEWIEEKEMLKSLRKSHSAKEWLDRMEAIVLENGTGKHMDNYSAIAMIYRG